MNKRIKVLLLFLLVGSMLFIKTYNSEEQYLRGIDKHGQQLTKKQEPFFRGQIISQVREMENLKPKPFYGQHKTLKNPVTGEYVPCTFDCSGFVLTVYKFANINFFEEQKGKIEEENGVKFIYKALKYSKKIYYKKIPKVADIVFFDKTWDRNHNGKVNDELTHVGIVLYVNKIGTVTFIHSSGTEGVKRDCVNLYHPDKEKLSGVTINSKIRERENADPPDTKYLAGELFNAFGTVFDVPQKGDDF